MAFNPNKYKGFRTDDKALPVILLLDVSGSMSGDKIDTLYSAVNQMVEELNDESKKQECGFKVAIFTFGAEVKLHTPYTDVKDLVGKIPPFDANGMTPLGTVLDLAKDMVEDKTVTKGRWYKPAVVLVSDGVPTDDYEKTLRRFIDEGRSAKCQRFSLGIGIQADFDMLNTFASQSDWCMHAENTADIVKAFKFVTMSVSARTVSNNPNVFPEVQRPLKHKRVWERLLLPTGAMMMMTMMICKRF